MSRRGCRAGAPRDNVANRTGPVHEPWLGHPVQVGLCYGREHAAAVHPSSTRREPTSPWSCVPPHGAGGERKRALSRRSSRLVIAAVSAWTIAAVAGAQANEAAAGASDASREVASATVVRVTPLSGPSPCSGRFIRHVLPHTTRANHPRQPFDSNGAGVALADLDGDRAVDIALAGLSAPLTVLWNTGAGLRFERMVVDAEQTRAVNAVDVDGDGFLDLVATRRDGQPLWLRGTGPARTFAPVEDGRFTARFPIHTMAWADLDGDGDLDLVGGTYDEELDEIERRALFLSRMNDTDPDTRTRLRGVYYYENLGSREERNARNAFQPDNLLFQHLRLSGGAMALAIALPDLDGDGRRDIVVGNDYDVPDYVYLNRPRRWVPSAPFRQTTYNTMAFAEGDLDNDGRFELFAADMKPYAAGPEVDAAWAPVLPPDAAATDREQIYANTLQVRGDDGSFENRASGAGVDATGWSWSAQFGDLDNDGDLDLYTVNGMVGEAFGHLPGAELVEQNQALRNDGSGAFAPAPEWGLGAVESGRGMALADLDLDGDLDIVVNNFQAPAVLFENQVCGGASLQVDLAWSGSANPFAIGAQLRLTTDKAAYWRETRVGSGYLSSAPPRAHFGFPTGERPRSVSVLWPDGAESTVTRVMADALIAVQRRAD